MTDISSTTTPIDTTNKSWESTYGGSETALASPAEPKVEPMKETVETAGPSKAPRTAKPKPAKKPVAKKSKLPPTPKPQRHRNPPLPKEQSK